MSEISITAADVERLITEADIPKGAPESTTRGIDVCDAIDVVIPVLETIRDRTTNPWVKLALTIAITALNAYKQANCR